ncbi:MAG TPA: zf-TFIIB domain-containing protein [Fimbriimonadaceae bacterium]
MPFTCPDDGTQLVIETFHGVSLEVCPTCDGIWFRQDQLTNMLSGDSHVLEELGKMHFLPRNAKTDLQR